MGVEGRPSRSRQDKVEVESVEARRVEMPSCLRYHLTLRYGCEPLMARDTGRGYGMAGAAQSLSHQIMSVRRRSR